VVEPLCLGAAADRENRSVIYGNEYKKVIWSMQTSGFEMALKSNFCYYVIGTLAMLPGGCGTTNDIDEKYLIVNKISIVENKENHGTFALKIQGDYAESAWGII